MRPLLLPVFVVGLLLVLAPGPATGQIVNTLGAFDAGETGWSGSLGGALRSTGGNSEIFDVAADAQIQRQTERQRWRALFGYEFSSSDGEDDAEALFGHLRHNLRLAERWRSLAFVQVQRNPFQRLRSRFLLGAGARADLVRGEKSLLALGLAHMLEIERLENEDEASTRQRLSGFVDLRLPVGERASFAATAFVQPAWADLGDLRATLAASLEAQLVGRLSLVSSFDVAHDSEPPAEVEKTDWTVRTGLRLRL